MKLDTKIQKMQDQINSIQELQDELESEKNQLLNDLWYLRAAGFVKCSEKNKTIKQNR